MRVIKRQSKRDPSKALNYFAMTEREFNRYYDGGFCLACMAEASGIEPDARGYACEACGEPRVYGAEELLLMGRIIVEE